MGEQILEINGIDFVNITHADAAEIIRTSRRMTMVLKDVGKIPISRIIYDKTEWIKRDQLKQRLVKDTEVFKHLTRPKTNVRIQRCFDVYKVRIKKIDSKKLHKCKQALCSLRTRKCYSFIG